MAWKDAVKNVGGGSKTPSQTNQVKAETAGGNQLTKVSADEIANKNYEAFRRGEPSRLAGENGSQLHS